MFAPRAIVMSIFLERVRAALAPEYSVERELASGGMGVVFLAHDAALDVPVAVKILRQELATAEAAERFVREAQTAAELRHPNIVTVHFAGERGGLYFYVMDYIEDPTLAQRLEQGFLRPAAVVRLGRDLLDALEHAHAHGVVHRDIKPSNIFVARKRALLGDFGIAKRMAGGATATTGGERTAAGVVSGTEGYMPPEQALGGQVTPRTDLYAVGMVLYEALTKRRWLVFEPERASWSGVPRAIARVLGRALEYDPERRWPDAATFRRNLRRTLIVKYLQRTIALAGLCLVAGAAGDHWIGRRYQGGLWPFRPHVGLRIDVEPFQAVIGADPSRAGDSVALGLVRSLKGYLDFSVEGPAPASRIATRSSILLSGTTRVVGESLLVQVRARAGPRGGQLFAVGARGLAARTDRVIDTLAYGVVRSIWNRENPLDPSLPVAALPQTAAGLAAWLHAERLLAQARWGEADVAYQMAELADSTCWLCYWRHATVAQWLGREADPTLVTRYLAHASAFPPVYRALIRAQQLPLRERLDALEQAADRWRSFLPAWFMAGDERFHRGPLVGGARSDAIIAFERTSDLRPDFAPAWEHLVWAETAEGDSAGAAAALDRLERSGEPRDATAGGIRALLKVARAWRFLGSAQARRVMREQLSLPLIATYPDLPAAPRFLMTFDAPRGAIEMGADFAARQGQPALARSGLIAQVFGYTALGMMDSGLTRARTLADRFPDPNLTILGPELAGVMLLVEPEDRGAKWAEVRAALEEQSRPRAGTPESRQRAAWMLALLARELRDPDAERYSRLLASGAPPLLQALVAASEDALRRNRWRALAATDSGVQFSASELAAAGVGDPFYRTVLHLLRAQWYATERDPDGARRELQWYQANDYVNYPTGDPQVGDADQALGTVARWRIAKLLDRGPAACRAYGDVQRLWAQGDPRYRARADAAARRFAELHCKAGA